MTDRLPVALVLAASIPLLSSPVRGDDKVVLRGSAAQVSIALGGGGIVEFRFLDQKINPLNWQAGEPEPVSASPPKPRGHFLCLDRWGPPSAAEAKRGVPFHGEAPRVVWQLVKPQDDSQRNQRRTEMGCLLPLAGLRIRRTLRLEDDQALLTVVEEVTNTGPRGRIYNMVQHPSIAPPFLDDSTLVDSNAGHGFAQSGPVPESEQTASTWPRAVIRGGSVDLTRFRDTTAGVTQSDVSSFVFAESTVYGWVTASNPGRGLLIGYVWKTSDYPWLNIWRYIQNGRVAARGLEFGTTGYHQPFPVLVRTGRILGRSLYDFIDADQTIRRKYVMFLLKIPEDYHGVAEVSIGRERLTVVERGSQNPRTLKLETSRLFER